MINVARRNLHEVARRNLPVWQRLQRSMFTMNNYNCGQEAPYNIGWSQCQASTWEAARTDYKTVFLVIVLFLLKRFWLSNTAIRCEIFVNQLCSTLKWSYILSTTKKTVIFVHFVMQVGCLKFSRYFLTAISIGIGESEHLPESMFLRRKFL